MRVLISILLLCYSIAIVSCSLFSSTDIFISSNPMMIYSNGTAVDFDNVYLKPREFKSGIVPFDNLTQPPSSGLEGILYDRGYSCQPDASFGFKRPDLLNMSSKIALVKKGGGCSFYQKVYLSELDGASGVIIFDDIAFRDDDNSGSMVNNL
ncbi:hypothetical protein EDC96DRAFT_526695 [Choanephora cucurbitarum]|nr:hypothetical protein EDC96DRAFT_526695 [Choanephora cucurbitarum]